MKKKLIPLILALVCAATCVSVLTACNNGGKEVIGVRLASVETPSEKKETFDIGAYVYGEDDKINENLTGIKFYKQYDDGSYEEAAESELTVKYEKDGVTLSQKPTTYTAAAQSNESIYRFTYSIDGATNTSSVSFTVTPAKSEGFSVVLSKTTWHYGENNSTVTLKNPAGTVMQKSQGYQEGTGLKDDGEYGWVSLYALKKTDYTQAGANAKIYATYNTREEDEQSPNHGKNKYFGEKLIGYTEGQDGDLCVKEGEYVLIAVIDRTLNYKEMVCTAEFTVTAPESPLGKTFVLTDMSVRGDGGSAAPQEFLDMVTAMKPEHLGETAVCGQNGEITGTFSLLNETPFDDMTGNDALTLTFGKEADEHSTANPLYVYIKNGYEDQDKVELTGEFYNGKLYLSFRQFADSVCVYWDFTFELQEA